MQIIALSDKQNTNFKAKLKIYGKIKSGEPFGDLKSKVLNKQQLETLEEKAKNIGKVQDLDVISVLLASQYNNYSGSKELKTIFAADIYKNVDDTLSVQQKATVSYNHSVDEKGVLDGFSQANLYSGIKSFMEDIEERLQ